MQPTRNTIEISPEANVKTESARQALLALKKTFQHWVMIGDAIVTLRARAEELGGRKTFHRLLNEQGLGALVKAKAITSRLEKIMARLPEVQEWHRTLSDKQQIEWSSPGSVLNHCPVFAKAGAKPKLDRTARFPKGQKQTMSAAEYEQLTAQIDEQKDEIESLREQLESAQQAEGKTKTKPTTDTETEIQKLRDQVAELENGFVGDISDALIEIHNSDIIDLITEDPDPEKWPPKALAYVREWMEDWTYDEMFTVQCNIESLASALESLEFLKKEDPERYDKLLATGPEKSTKGGKSSKSAKAKK